MAKEPSIFNLTFEDYQIPILHYKEYRASVRFSITKKGLVIRSPIFSPSKTLRAKAISWCKNLALSKPAALIKFKKKEYATGDLLTILGEDIELNIDRHNNKKDVIRWKKDRLEISIHHNYDEWQHSKIVGGLIAKFVAKRFQKPLEDRVRLINQKLFGVEINAVKIKNNHSNWGSCSTKGNINLSTRLLLAPAEVIDYVIIHELAHRKEMNHSKRFWTIVSAACPDYKRHEKWLKTNSHLCAF